MNAGVLNMARTADQRATMNLSLVKCYKASLINPASGSLTCDHAASSSRPMPVFKQPSANLTVVRQVRSTDICHVCRGRRYR